MKTLIILVVLLVVVGVLVYKFSVKPGSQSETIEEEETYDLIDQELEEAVNDITLEDIENSLVE